MIFFSNAFSNDEAKAVVDATVANGYDENPRKEKWRPMSCADTIDKVFLLSIKEYSTYLYGDFETVSTAYANKRGSKGMLWGKTVSQYTRSFGAKKDHAAYLYYGFDPMTDMSSSWVELKDGIRPAMWIDISSKIEKNDFEVFAEAKSYENKKQFQQAAELYEQLGNYNNSESHARNCRYWQAIIAAEKGDYPTALAVFEALGDYEDSYALSRECLYNYAESCYSSGNYLQAAELYDELGQYKDSMEKLIDCFDRLYIPYQYFDNDNIQWYDTGVDKGYSGTKTEKKGLHKGWTLGKIFISDYTQRENWASDHPTFVKSLGNAVTLRFNLEQDIDCLNGDKKLTISSDTNGFDKKLMKDVSGFNEPFGRGTLIIRHTNNHNESRVIGPYTDYLLAKGTTGANTKVVLEEEGEYEVALDYEVMKKGIKTSLGNYSIRFKFNIRNGDMAVHFLDIGNGSELLDKSITSDGFRIRVLSSSSLNISVHYYTIITESSGYKRLNENAPRIARDGQEYSREGIYVITVTDPRTNESMSKTIFVGDDDLRTQYDELSMR